MVWAASAIAGYYGRAVVTWRFPGLMAEALVLSTSANGSAPMPWAGMMMALAIVGVGFYMTFMIRGKIARRNAARPSSRELIEQLKSPVRLSSDAHSYTAELEQIARRLSAQLDNKARRLENLIDEADRRIASLGGPSDPPVAPSPRPAGANGDRDPDALTVAVYERADAGLSSIEIAQQLDEQVGKVELILALREP